MEHSYYQERLSAFADNELTPEERAQVAEHLRECGDCQKRLNDLEALSQLTSRHSVLDDSDYWEKAAQKIEGRLDTAATTITDVTPKQSRQSSGLWWKLPAIAASVVIVGYIGLHESDILREADTEKPLRTLRSMEVTPPEERAGRTNLPDTVVVAEESEVDLPQPVMMEDIHGGRGEGEVNIAEGRALREGTVMDETEGLVYAPSPPQETVTVTGSDYQVLAIEDRDENYKRRSLPKAASEHAETEPAAPKVEVDDLADFEEPVLAETFQLDDWRQRRDSILLAIQNLPPEVPPRQRKSTGVQGFTATRGTDTSGIAADVVERVAKVELEKELVEAWYQICLLSDDSTEKTTGKEFLDSVATDEGSPNRNLADSLYKLIEQQ